MDDPQASARPRAEPDPSPRPDGATRSELDDDAPGAAKTRRPPPKNTPRRRWAALSIVLGLGVLVGGELFALGRADDALESGRLVVSVDAGRVDPANEGRLVHMTGELSTREVLVDPIFHVSVSALRLVRHVEMYQWQERMVDREQRVDGGTRTVSEPQYEGTWSAEPIDSDGFEQEEGHENPEFPAEDETLVTSRPMVGAFSVPPELLEGVTETEALAPDSAAARGVSLEGREGRIWNDLLYVGQDPSNPRVGDLRVRFARTPFTNVTVVGAQRGSELKTWTAPSGREHPPHLVLGAEDATDAAADITDINTPVAWALRLLGWLLTWLGVWVLLRHAMGTEKLVRLSRMLEAGALLPAAALATPLCVLIVGGLWTAHRPVIGGLLLTLGAVSGIFGLWLVRRRLAKRAAKQAAKAGPTRDAKPDSSVTL